MVVNHFFAGSAENKKSVTNEPRESASALTAAERKKQAQEAKKARAVLMDWL